MKMIKLNKTIEINNFNWNGNVLSASYTVENQTGNCFLELMNNRGTRVDVFTITTGSSLKLNGNIVKGLSVPAELKTELAEVKAAAKETYQIEIDNKFGYKEIMKVSFCRSGISAVSFTNTTRGQDFAAKLEDAAILNKLEKALKVTKKADMSEYDFTMTYEVTAEQLEKMIEEVEEVEIEEIEAAIETEKQHRNEIETLVLATGESQILRQYNAPCNDPNEECDLDHVTIWLLPGGKELVDRQHTW